MPVFGGRVVLEQPKAEDKDAQQRDELTSKGPAQLQAAAEAAAGNALRQSKGIEVGQVFYFGDKYTKAMGVSVQGADGQPVTPLMGSYGIGVSRLVGGDY